MFFSLDPLETKNQLPTINTKCQLKFFFVVSFLTEKRQPGLFSSQNGVTSKTFRWHFVFSSWFLVASETNEKNTC